MAIYMRQEEEGVHRGSTPCHLLAHLKIRGLVILRFTLSVQYHPRRIETSWILLEDAAGESLVDRLG